MEWLSWLSKKETPLLAKQLEHYLPYLAPHCGDHNTFTPDQSRANLNYFLAHKSERINHLANLLAHFDIDLHSHLLQGEYQGLIQQLYQWACSEWLTAIHTEHTTWETWRTTHRQGEHILYSVAMDTSIALGEIIISRQPTFKWALDLDPDNIKDQMPSANRIVLAAPSHILSDSTAIIDLEMSCASTIINSSLAQRALNSWLKHVDDATSGLVEGTWVKE